MLMDEFKPVALKKYKIDFKNWLNNNINRPLSHLGLSRLQSTE